MEATLDHPGHSTKANVADPPHAMLARIIERCAHLLPAQGPITVFIHHNTLHAFEELPFAEAVKKGAQVFGCQPYLSEDRYRAELIRGRIRFADLNHVVEEDLGEGATAPIPAFKNRLELRLAMLQFPLRIGPTDELIWHVAEANALRKVRQEASSAQRARMIAETRRWVLRDLRPGLDRDSASDLLPRQGVRPVTPSLADLLTLFGLRSIETWSDETWEGFMLQALWRICCDGVRELPAFTPKPPPLIRHRDLLLEVTSDDSDMLVHRVLIPFCAAFLDQGLAQWNLPQRDHGFLRAFCSLYRQPGGPPIRWMNGLDRELARIVDQSVSGLECIHESLHILGVPHSEWEDYLAAVLLDLRGWGGMLHQIESRGDKVVHPAPKGSLVEFLAVRLLLDRFAIAHLAHDALGFTGKLEALRDHLSPRIHKDWQPSVEQRAFLVFQLAQVCGISPDQLFGLDATDWSCVLSEIETFSTLERRRIFHLAYERHFCSRALDAVALHAQRPRAEPFTPSFQAIFCIDDREESIRRHVEELAPDAETFGTAGFFSVPMYYRGAAEAHYVPLCPAIIVPKHYVAERVIGKESKLHKRSARTRRLIGIAIHHFQTGSRSPTSGALLSTAVGVLASIPLVARTLFPRLYSLVSSSFGRMLFLEPETALELERTLTEPGPEPGHVGFSIEEMSTIAQKVLDEIGLTNCFARLVMILGHGSTSLNNPHESAYDCGACGGSRGGPNARALAQMLNDSRVRSQLASRGLVIPDSTIFVGGLHNTSTEAITYFDTGGIPSSHRAEFESTVQLLDLARDRNAHERCRRFHSAPLTISLTGAREHVEGRAADLGQVRPELGHATNAIVVVGRRDTTRGLFLDRRAFLASYNPFEDDAEFSVLTRILQAVFPVCSGINLEYYFSYVDNPGWGSGTKLPHNITAMLGVMDGYQSDLRTGLPWQMVEVHEPVRSLFIIEATPAAIVSIMDKHPSISRLCKNGWILLAVLDPHSHKVSVFRDDRFLEYTPHSTALPRAQSSVDWYRGWRDHLDFAQIQA